ncbi:hypothetical protein AB3S75_046376 [Citrus x aurantiifolia]
MSVEDLRHSILYTTLELEQTRLAVQEDLKKRDDQLVHLKDLLSKVIRERDAAHEKCQRLLYEKLCFNSSSSNKQLVLCQEFLCRNKKLNRMTIAVESSTLFHQILKTSKQNWKSKLNLK